jgi:hypothetical protein
MSSIWSLLAQYKVPIVLNGHDHDYQRWVPLDGNGQPSPTGVTEFVVGSAGHGIQKFLHTDSRVAYANDTQPAAFGILLLQLTQSDARFTYQNTYGTTLDSGDIPCGMASTNTTSQVNSHPNGFSLAANTPAGYHGTWMVSSVPGRFGGTPINWNGSSFGIVPDPSLTIGNSNSPLVFIYPSSSSLAQSGNEPAASPPA